MVRPSPAPPISRFLDVSPRYNGSKMCGKSSTENPEPESSTEMYTLLCSTSHLIHICPPFGVCLKVVLHILFVNAGITTPDRHVPIGNVTTEDFMRVMVTNALSPVRAIEVLQDLVPADGLIGVMSSGQGSITNNENGLWELYRGSKAALNMFMRSFAARQMKMARTLVLMAPGWVRTELGGPDAPLSIEDSVPSLVNVLVSKLGSPGLQYVDYHGRTVPW